MDDAPGHVCVAEHRFRLADGVGPQYVSATVVTPATGEDAPPRITDPVQIQRAGSVPNKRTSCENDVDTIVRGRTYTFNAIYAVAPPRPMIGFARLGGDLPAAGDDGPTSTLTTVGTDIPLGMFFRRGAAPRDLRRFRVNIATGTDAPGRHVLVGLSGMTALFGARSGDIPLDVLPAYRFGPSGGEDGNRFSLNVQFDIGTILKEAKGVLL